MMAQQKKTYRYDSVPGDPIKARIYTLDNGLKVYMSVYNDAPRIQTYIAVRVGSKNDPPETTGLAHYFEHMMFKGTQNYGTTDWQAEQPYITQIDSLFEVYRKEKDDLKRAGIYQEIDSLSYEASRIAISNEYDKLMDAIGSQGSNAGTSNDYTIYMENIPANMVESWAQIESDRFSNPVLRLFHTEVETVYEEKNRSLTSDSRKVNEATLRLLFPNHPYGKQTTLGETEHLKNPSMKNIREFFAKYYVPNNMAICMAGDFDPDETIRIIDENFGKLKPGEIPKLSFPAWTPPATPLYETITGLEAESVRISWAFDIPATSRDANMIKMISMILYNGKAGLIDMNLNQPQKVLQSYCLPEIMNDYSYLAFSGRPRTGQSLEELKDLILAQVELLKKGEFPDWMTEATVNNMKLDLVRQNESNQGRAMAMSSAFLSYLPWEQSVSAIHDAERITKQDIVAFANRYLGEDFVVIYKKQGTPPDVEKIAKPPITPININYEDESTFMTNVKKKKVDPIQPEFLDYKRDIAIRPLSSGIRLLCNQNREDDLFTMTYYYKIGKNSDKETTFALALLPYLGTSKHSLAEINQEFYRIACDMDVVDKDEDCTITLSGLGSNFKQALSLMEEVLNDCQPDQEALDNLVNNVLKRRKDQKSNQQEIFNALISYSVYGKNSPYNNILSEDSLKGLTAEEMVSKIRSLGDIEHQVIYYGPMTADEVMPILGEYHATNKQLKPPPQLKIFIEKPTDTDQVFFVNYNAKQARLESMIRGRKYDPQMVPSLTLFDYYMGNLSFQELREKRALAYSAYSRFLSPPDLERYYQVIGFIGTQNDKMIEAFHALNELYNNMPLTETGFNAAKDGVTSRIRTEKIRRNGIIWNFLDAERHGLDYDIRKNIFDSVSDMTMDNIREVNSAFMKDKKKTYIVLGKESELDFAGLEKLGPVTKLTLEEIFGY